jgi:hypothetical protein
LVRKKIFFLTEILGAGVLAIPYVNSSILLTKKAFKCAGLLGGIIIGLISLFHNF